MVFQLGKQAVFMRLGHFLRRRAVQQRLELPQRAFREGQTRCFEQQKGFDRTVLPQFFERTDTEPVQGGDGFGGERRRTSMVYSPKTVLPPQSGACLKCRLKTGRQRSLKVFCVTKSVGVWQVGAWRQCLFR